MSAEKVTGRIERREKGEEAWRSFYVRQVPLERDEIEEKIIAPYNARDDGYEYRLAT